MSCSTITVSTAPRVLNPKPWSAFEIDGRLAVRYRQESSLANFHWQHSPARDRLTLYSPLGQTVAVLTRDESGVCLTDNQHHIHRAATMALLTDQVLGWQLPLQDLTYWIEGSAIPDKTYQLLPASDTRSMQLIQSGWVVNYKRWMSVAGMALPNNLTLTGHGATVHLVISNWQLTGLK